MAETSSFDLHALVRQIADSGLRGPREIAAKVAENVPANKVRVALAQALVTYVRVELTRSRQPYAAPVGNVNSARSSKVRAIREGWQRMLRGQFHIGDGQWKTLAECSYEQVLFLATERQETARRNAAAAAMFETLAAAMKKHRVAVVADLPERVLASTLTAEDAA